MGRLRILTIVAVLALAAVACGNSKPTTPKSGGTTPAATASPLTNKGTTDATAVTAKQEIEMDNEGTTAYYFKPSFLKVKTGQIMTVELKNEGTVPHTFTITALGIDKQVEAGKEAEVNITFPASSASDIQFFCRFHVGFGMRGAFFFGSAPQATGTSSSKDSSSGGY